MRIVFYISGHGLGHATRCIEVIDAVKRRAPGTSIVVRTAAPRWIFDRRLPGSMDVQPCETDTGMAQIDSLRLDEIETARRAAAFYGDIEHRADREADCLRALGASLVVGDIPPLASMAASRAGLASIAIGNFTWDWIYAAYDAFERLAPDVVPTVSRAYGLTTRALRLPLHGGFASMSDVLRDIPFVARQSRRDRRDVRRVLQVPEARPVVLASFGGYGVDLPYEAVAREGGLTVITTDRLTSDHPGLIRIDLDQWHGQGFRYEDLVAAADVVVGKPGYGIVSECVANGTALLYTSRGRFAEYDVFAAEMPRYLRCRFIARDALLAGTWTTSVHELLDQPPPAGQPRIDGADLAAEEIVSMA